LDVAGFGVQAERIEIYIFLLMVRAVGA